MTGAGGGRRHTRLGASVTSRRSATLPIGVDTAIVGVPIFLVLLRTRREKLL